MSRTPLVLCGDFAQRAPDSRRELLLVASHLRRMTDRLVQYYDRRVFSGGCMAPKRALRRKLAFANALADVLDYDFVVDPDSRVAPKASRWPHFRVVGVRGETGVTVAARLVQLLHDYFAILRGDALPVAHHVSLADWAAAGEFIQSPGFSVMADSCGSVIVELANMDEDDDDDVDDDAGHDDAAGPVAVVNTKSFMPFAVPG